MPARCGGDDLARLLASLERKGNYSASFLPPFFLEDSQRLGESMDANVFIP